MYSTDFDGERVEFGTSGFLYRSNKLMFDRKTETLWHQFRVVPALGSLVGSKLELEVLPVTLTLWSNWVAEHPDTTVLNIDTGIYPADSSKPEMEGDSAYFVYRNQANTMFLVPQRNSDLTTKNQVFGLAFDGEAKAYPLSLFEDHVPVNDILAGQNVVIVPDSSGSGVRAYDRSDHIFAISSSSSESAVILDDENGADWLAEADSLVRFDDTSQTLERLPSRNAYWFGWYAFYPHTDTYTP